MGRAKRRILAVVERGGMPLDTLTVASFKAPKPTLPAKPRGLRLLRTGNSVVAAWTRAPGVNRTIAYARLSDGRRLSFVATATLTPGASTRVPAGGRRGDLPLRLAGVAAARYGRLSMSATTVDGSSAAPRLLGVAALGALVAVALGVYGRVHDPSEELVFNVVFSSTISMKVWLGSAAAVLAVVQVVSAMWVYGKFGPAPAWAGGAHRISGRLAFICSLPVAYHCLWSLGFQDTDTRVLAHSLLGCAVYGAFAAKVTIVRSGALPGLALPVAGGIMFAVLIGAWLTSALWFINEQGWPAL